MKSACEVNGEWILSFRDEQYKLDNEADAEQLAKAIENADRVEVLELRGNTIGVEAGQRLAVALERHPELKRSLCDAMIRSGTQLVELDLSDNAFGPIGAEGIEKFLESPSAYSLEVLKLNNNGLGAGGKIIAGALIRCYENAKRDGQNFCLKTFIAGRNRLEDPGAFALAKAFQVLGSLEEITMYQDGIRSKGIEALAKSLRYNPHLRIINLSDNTFTESGARAVAQALRDLTNLEVLNFGDCLCRSKGAYAIIASLSPMRHSKLKEINLSGNELSPGTIENILSRINDFHLKSLVLHTNNIGGRFHELKSKWEKIDFVDFGEESDDQGTLDENEDDDVEELFSDGSHSGDADYESDDEQTENVGDTDRDDKSLKGGNGENIISFRNERWNSAEDAEAVVSALISRNSLKVLDLHGNYISIGACKRIAEAMRLRKEQKHMEELVELNLSWSGISEEGMKELAGAFRYNPNLKIINLSGNSLKIDGAVALAVVLPTLRLLEVLDLGSCDCQERGILAIVANLNSSTHLRLKTLDFSSNGLEADAVQTIIRVFASGGFHLERLSLHSNHVGDRFTELKEAFSCIQFLDLGDDNCDRGSLKQKAGNMRVLERESGNEGDDERTEDADRDVQDDVLAKGPASLTMEDVILFTRKPTVAVLEALLSHVKSLIEILQADLRGRTQEVTAALLCSFCTLLSLEGSVNQQLREKIIALADAILNEAKKIMRQPVSPTESLCNQLLIYARYVKTETSVQSVADVNSVICLLQSMIQRGHFRELLPTIKFWFSSLKDTYPNRSAAIDRFLQTL